MNSTYQNQALNPAYILSNKSVDALAANGYESFISDKLIQFKKKYDFIGALILLFMYGLIALPLFDFNYWLGASLFILLILGIYLHRILVSKPSTIQFDRQNKRISVTDKTGNRNIAFGEVNGVFIRSRYLGTYSSANKGTNEEYDISLGVELIKGETIDLFYYKSDYRKPSKEVMEVHDYMKTVLKHY